MIGLKRRTSTERTGRRKVSDKQTWTVPPELAAYDEYINYPGRAEELINSKASFFSNAVVATMRAETDAQYALLRRLRNAGLLLHPDDAHILCKECKRAWDNCCPDCGACEAACHDDGTNTCLHPNAAWVAKST